jgi:hypothetical protein
MIKNQCGHDFAVSRQCPNGIFFIITHQATVACYIRTENRTDLAVVSAGVHGWLASFLTEIHPGFAG